MVSDPNSDSRKVFDAMVNKSVNQKVNQKASQILNEENARAQQESYKNQLSQQAREFAARNSLTKDEFINFMQEAQHKFNTEGMTFDDMYLIVNKGRAATNVANSTKKEMLNQMKNVRDIPASQGASNNAGKPAGKNDAIFDALLSSDGNIEELLG